MWTRVFRRSEEDLDVRVLVGYNGAGGGYSVHSSGDY